MTDKVGSCTKTAPLGTLCRFRIRATESLAQIDRKLKVFWLQLASIRQSFRILPCACLRSSPKIPANILATTPCSCCVWLKQVGKFSGLISRICRSYAPESILALLQIKYRKMVIFSHRYRPKLGEIVKMVMPVLISSPGLHAGLTGAITSDNKIYKLRARALRWRVCSASGTWTASSRGTEVHFALVGRCPRHIK